jgi:hypothetical protein
MTVDYDFPGHCPICETATRFFATSDEPVAEKWLARFFRENLRCPACRSVPRERAVAHVLNEVVPEWRNLAIHECSPGGRGLSPKLKRQCISYVATQYDPALPPGTLIDGRWRNEDLENQTFPDAAFDLVITQDVFEHVFHPGKAASEIARTLKEGGYCLMTVPVVRPWATSQRRASPGPHGPIHHLSEQYHGNPVGGGKSLVTIDWAFDIAAYLTKHSGMPFVVMAIDDMRIGVRDPVNAVLLARKMHLADLGE